MGYLKHSAPPPICKGCGNSIGPRRMHEGWGKWQARKFCSDACRDKHRREHPAGRAARKAGA